MAPLRRRPVRRKMALSRPHCGARGRQGRGPERGRPASERPDRARSPSPRAPGERRAGAGQVGLNWRNQSRHSAHRSRARSGEPGRGRARDAEFRRLPQTAPGTRRLTGRGSAERLPRGPGVSARPPSLPCILLTAGWPEAGGPMGPGVPPPPPEPPPPLGLGAAIVGSEEPSGAAAAAMQQAWPLAPLRARRAPP